MKNLRSRWLIVEFQEHIYAMYSLQVNPVHVHSLRVNFNSVQWIPNELHEFLSQPTLLINKGKIRLISNCIINADCYHRMISMFQNIQRRHKCYKKQKNNRRYLEKKMLTSAMAPIGCCACPCSVDEAPPFSLFWLMVSGFKWMSRSRDI